MVMDSPHLIYFADPMCSWCWGFAPVIEAVHRTFGGILPIRLVLGGLRPGTTGAMSAEARRELAGHWTHVTQASGQPFDAGFVDREGFVYDTDPAARAVVLLRRDFPEKALAFLGHVQGAFYARNIDVTSAAVLADLAADFGMDRGDFLARFEDQDLKDETWRDYAISQRAGVTGFPTLVAGPSAEGTYGVVTRGFQPADQILPVLQRWVEGRA
jgi:putative protein-disulfide isomerase